MISARRRPVVAAAVVGLVATAASAAGSWTPSLWGDEAASILSAERPLGSLLMMIQHVDAVHGLYYLGLHGWVALFGTSAFSVRAPSALAAGITAAGLVVLGHRLRGLRLGILAGLVVAVLPRMTDVGSEARSYAMTAAVATWLTVILIVQLQTPVARRRWWVAYGILLAVGTALFIWVALVAAAHLLSLLTTRTRLRGITPRLGGWVIATTGALLAASPVLLLALLERSQIAYLEQRQYYDVTSILVTPWFESPAVAAIGWLLTAAGAVLCVRRTVAAPASERAELIAPAVWLLLPAAFLLGFSALIAVYTPRYLSMCVPAVALLIALPLDALLASRRRVEAAVAAAALLASIAPVWVAQRGPFAKNESDWAQISAQLARHARPGDAMAFDDSVRPSRRTRLAMRTYPAGFAGLLDPTLESPFTRNDTWYDETVSIPAALRMGRFADVTRVWLVEYASPSHADTIGVTALEADGFHLVSTIRGHRSAILELERP